MIAWVMTPYGEGALVGFIGADHRDGPNRAIVLIDKRFHAFLLGDIEWLRWPD